jgi:thiol-disulfide isomerase/thioredoxin/outer membrane lipoprotein-sorting protein
MRAVLAFALQAWAARAQPPPLPDAKTLYERAQATAKSFHSLQFAVEMTMEPGLPGAPMNMTTEMSSAYLNPGKTRTEAKAAGATFLDVSDGENTWVYSSVGNQYAKIPAAQGPGAVMAAMGVNLPDMSSIHTSHKTIGEDSIEIEGQKHDCWIVEVQIGEVPLPVPSAQNGRTQPKITNAVMRSWIDKKLGLDIETTLVMSMQMGGPDIKMRQKIVKKSIRIDQPIDEALFTFTPPPGAAEVKELKLAGPVAAKPELTGKPASAFEVQSMEGKTFSLAALKGKVVLLDFWATWCLPCRRSMPALDKIALDFKDSGLVILGVNSGEDREVVDAFLKKTPLGYPAVLSGESGILEAYRVTAYPTFVLIGRDGKIVANEIGFRDEDQLRQMIDRAGLLANKQ